MQKEDIDKENNGSFSKFENFSKIKSILILEKCGEGITPQYAELEKKLQITK